MDSLSETLWDVAIYGTGLPQSLLALALSRSGKKILHLDKNEYYGGTEAALSLDEIEEWSQSSENGHTTSAFPVTAISIPRGSQKLGFSRAYSLTLSPQLIYTRSALLPALVSSKIHGLLDFLAVGTWWLYDDVEQHHDASPSSDHQQVKNPFRKLPGGREDIFANQDIDLRSTRSLMKFLKVAADKGRHDDLIKEWGRRPFTEYLSSEFGIRGSHQNSILALTLSPEPMDSTDTAFALPRIHRHLTSIGVFGSGFGSILPKWGGLAEIAQVSCRAGAVGGGIYMLGQEIKDLSTAVTAYGAEQAKKHTTMKIELANGEKLAIKQLVISQQDRVASINDIQHKMCRSISIVSSPLKSLFPSLLDDPAPTPAGAVVVFPPDSLATAFATGPQQHPPVHLLIHSSDTGECPAGQSVIHAHGMLAKADSGKAAQDTFALLDVAVDRLLDSIKIEDADRVLWRIHYVQNSYANRKDNANTKETVSSVRPHVITLADIEPSLILEDSVLDDVKRAWEAIVPQEERESQGLEFMVFPDREGMADADADNDSDDM